MTPHTLSTLPDETPVYVEGYGVTDIGTLRVTTEEKPGVDDEAEATVEMWEDLATRNLLRKPCQKPVSHSDIKAYHASRYTRAQTLRGTR